LRTDIMTTRPPLSSPSTIGPMKVGMVVPIVDEGTPAGVPDWPVVASLAARAEAGGLDSLWIIDHLVLGNAERPEYGVHEAVSVLAALAASTRRAELGTLVLATSFRPPAVLAKMAATIDRVAGGRLILGLGCGWHEPEYRAFGFPFDHRVGRFEEAMSIIAPLLDGSRVTVDGRFYQVEECVLLPPPARSIPILIAGKGERMLSLVARHADQWNAAWFGRPNARWRGRVADLHRAFEAADRDPASIAITAGVEVDNGDTGDRTGVGEHLPADPSAIADALAEWAAEGVAHVQLNSGPTDERLVDIFADAVERFRRR
jgi:alkanesulfonate monooxygenase SsuD/methylene tetrahydromethanopterin reductase-like flavin-dependent oxidoreductase (luciferase family)